MNTLLTAMPLSLDASATLKKKRVRKLGMDVDCAADITEARCWWRPKLYDLVLMNVEKGRGHRDKFCEDVRGAKPPQRLAFLVGEPAYLADVPNEEETSFAPEVDGAFMTSDVRALLLADVKGSQQRWGILEASRKISEVRSACTARSRAIQDRPAPPRDYEVRAEKTTATTLDDLLREEMQ
jgi:hypothetical protein